MTTAQITLNLTIASPDALAPDLAVMHAAFHSFLATSRTFQALLHDQGFDLQKAQITGIMPVLDDGTGIPESLAQYLQEHQVSDDGLDELVIDNHESRSSEINNSGFVGQITHLLKEGFTVKQIVEQAQAFCPAGKIPVPGEEPAPPAGKPKRGSRKSK